MISTSKKKTEDEDVLKKKGTYMRSSIQKMLKVKSAELDMKEYEVIEAALINFFKNKV